MSSSSTSTRPPRKLSVAKSLPSLKQQQQGAKTVHFTPSVNNGKKRQPLPQIPAEKEKEKAHDGHDDKKSTVSFVYSQAVERSFRRCFLSTDFGPMSAHPSVRQPAPPAPTVTSTPILPDIVALPQLYEDWLRVKQLLHNKRQHIETLREEGRTDETMGKHGKHGKYGSSKRTVSYRRTNMLQRSNTDSSKSLLASSGDDNTQHPNKVNDNVSIGKRLGTSSLHTIGTEPSTIRVEESAEENNAVNVDLQSRNSKPMASRFPPLVATHSTTSLATHASISSPPTLNSG